VGYLITVCRSAESSCPIYPWAGVREFWDLEDPAAFQGGREEKLQFFRDTRDIIQQRVLEFIERVRNQ